MKAEYDFSNSKPNPYTKLLKKEVKFKIDEDAKAGKVKYTKCSNSDELFSNL